MKSFIENICAESARDDNFMGVCVLTQGCTTIAEVSSGFAEYRFNAPNNTNVRFDTASVTKVFAAAAILRLVGCGKLALDDKIVDIIDLSGTTIPRDVTLRHLLTHTSGIADDADEEAGENYSDLFRDSPNYALRGCRDFLPNFAYKTPNFKAGTNVRYCNCSFILLGLAIEKVTGVDCRDYIEAEIFKRAGMERSGFFAMDEAITDVAEGYIPRYDGGRIVSYRRNIYSFPPRGTPDGGAYVTASDLIKFMDAVKSGALLSDEMTAILLSPQCPFVKEKEWFGIPGLRQVNGFAFEFLTLGGKTFCVCKDGCSDGVSAMLAYYPKPDMTLVILSNTDCDVWKMRRDIQLEIYNRYGN